MQRILTAMAVLWAGIETSGANYCRPEWRESLHYPQIPQATYEAWPETWLLVAGAALLFFILGRASAFPANPNKGEVRAEVEKAFHGRQGEAETHGREKKLTRPLDAARKSVLAALEKMGLA